MQDSNLVKEVHKIMNGELGEYFVITQDGTLAMKGGICEPNIDDLRRTIMEEAHYSAYAMHPVVSKCTESSRKTIGGQV